MSVIIKGMKMPKNCEECTFHSTEDIFFDIVHECEVKNNYIIKSDIHKIPPDCPLVALPEKHGRLIDADTLKADYGMKDDCIDCDKELRGSAKSCQYDTIYTKMDFCGWIDNAQTILEADAEE